MAYTINKFNGQELTQVLDSTINTATDLKLVGKNYAGYGELQNENFVFLLENFSNNSAPENAIKGQIWHDSSEDKLKFYDGNNWKSLGIIEKSPTAPNQNIGDVWYDSDNKQLKYFTSDGYKTVGVTEVNSLSPTASEKGNLWYDTSKEQLYIYNGIEFELIGPQKAGTRPTLFQSETVKDNTENDQSIIRGFVDGETVLVVSENQFILSPNTPIVGFTEVYKGITLANSINGSSDESGVWFWGTASEAKNLDGLNVTQFLRSDKNTDLTGSLIFTDNSTGLKWNNDIEITNNNNTLDFQIGASGIVKFSYTDGHSSYDLLEFVTDNTTDALQFRNNTVWHAGNHGAGSGLDADKLDGLDSTDYLRVNAKAVDSDKLDGLDKSAFLERSGGVMDGDVEFTGNTNGIVWERNTDGASIKFYSQSDNDSDARLEFQTKDNQHEYFLWTHKLSGSATSDELMRLSPADSTNGLTFRNNTVWHSGNDGPGSNLNADLLDGKQGSYYLDWTNVANKPDPTITVIGDVTGSITLTGLTGGILSTVVQKDSHRHTISTIDNLQPELNTKLPASQYTAQDVFAKVKSLDGAGSNLNADLLDGKHASDFLGVNQTASFAQNADKVDGLDANDLMRITGGQFTGFITLVSDPAENLHAATKQYVDNTVTQIGIPGEVSYFAMENAPTGWLKANGAEVSRSTYSDLFSAIGTRFGSGNGSSTFNLPDLRGEFIRGWDDARGIDSGRSFGSFQTDEFESHNHPLIGNNRGTISSQLYASGLYQDDAERVASDPDAIGYTGGNETRPRNIALLACIKF